MNLQSAILAKKTADSFTKKNPDKPRFVAGVLGPTNKMLSISPDVNNPGIRSISFDKLAEAYSVAVSGLVDGNVDILMIETVFDTLNCKAAIYAIKKYFRLKNINLPIMISGTITDQSGRTLSGQTPESFYYSVMHANPISVGLNCALGIDKLSRYIIALSEISSFYVSVHPNAGLPNEFGDYDHTPEFMARKLKGLAAAGHINIAGGCCGTTPEHIKSIAGELENIFPRKVKEKKHYTYLSGLEPLVIKPGSLFVNIGERTNVAGSKKFSRLIREKKYDEALDIARDQVESGAQVIRHQHG